MQRGSPPRTPTQARKASISLDEVANLKRVLNEIQIEFDSLIPTINFLRKDLSEEKEQISQFSDNPSDLKNIITSADNISKLITNTKILIEKIETANDTLTALKNFQRMKAHKNEYESVNFVSESESQQAIKQIEEARKQELQALSQVDVESMWGAVKAINNNIRPYQTAIAKAEADEGEKTLDADEREKILDAAERGLDILSAIARETRMGKPPEQQEFEDHLNMFFSLYRSKKSFKLFALSVKTGKDSEIVKNLEDPTMTWQDKQNKIYGYFIKVLNNPKSFGKRDSYKYLKQAFVDLHEFARREVAHQQKIDEAEINHPSQPKKGGK